MAMELRALFLLLLCFPGLQGQTPEAQRRREGNTLTIQCPYPAQPEYWQTKYWCRVTDGGCQGVVSTYSTSTQQSKDRRIRIRDDSHEKTVSITMTDLKAEDSGTYFCAIYKPGYVPLRTISLNVFRELLMWELDTLSVPCPYRYRYRYGAAWCRQGWADCVLPVERQRASRGSAVRSLQDRASIEYSGQWIVTVTMERLQSWDSGVYWCAEDSGHTQIAEVELTVLKRTQQHTVEESGNVTVQCHYKIADYSTVKKAWCKKEEGDMCNVLATTSSELPAGHSTAGAVVRIQDDTQQGIVTVTMEQLQVQDSGVYWCALQDRSGLSRMEEITLNVSKALSPGAFPDTESKTEEILLGDSPEPSSDGNTFIILSFVLLVLLLLALITSIALGVKHYKLLERTGNREAEESSDRPEGAAQPGSTGRRGSLQEDSKGPAYINLEVQSHSSHEDPLYCNVEPSQAPRKPQHVEYAVIAFNPSPRNGRE